jgi:hypothetical protein
MARRCATSLALAFAAALGGCASQGDFGRPQPSVVREELLPTAGQFFADRRDEPVSPFLLSDDERELRDRAWRFLMPMKSRTDFDGALVELRRTRVLAAAAEPEPPDTYFAALMSEPWRSSHPPYRRLLDDITTDERLLEPFFAVADRVVATDRIRRRGLAFVDGLRPVERDAALARIAENDGLLRWVDHALAERLAAYRYAQQRIFIEIPSRDGVAAERALARLSAAIASPRAPPVAVAFTSPSPARGYHPWPTGGKVRQP